MNQVKILFHCSGEYGFSIAAAEYAAKTAPPFAEIRWTVDRGEGLTDSAVKLLKNLGLPAKDGLSAEDREGERYDLIVNISDLKESEHTRLPGSIAGLDWKLKGVGEIKGSAEIVVEIFRQQLIPKIEALLEHGWLESLIQTRTTLSSLLENLTDGVMAHDLNRRIYYFNRAAEKITGYARSEVLNGDCHEVFPGRFCGGDCPFCDDGMPAHSRLRYPQTFVRPDGERLELEMSVVTIDTSSGGVDGALVIFRDVTEVLRMRQKLEGDSGFHGIIGRHSLMLILYESIRELANVNVPILIQGESGTGKEMVARALHFKSHRASQPFVPVNCGALPEGTLESELFGHVRGAFTGAIRDKKGRFELAEGGTIFLDEVGEISPAMQVKLLRVIQDKTFVPVGGEKQIEVDVRIICATNKDLKKHIQEGKFREDLYYRLAVIPLHLPPLRDKITDTPLLVEHFLKKYSGDTGKEIRKISTPALTMLMKYNFPGNVRELRNAIQYAMIKCQGDTLDISHLPPEIIEDKSLKVILRPGRKQSLDSDSVKNALKEAGGNKAKAVRLLGVSRTTLYRFLEKKKL